MTDKARTIAIIGGTGKLGQGLAYQLGKRGYPIVIGSREAAKAEASAREVSQRIGRAVQGKSNADAAAAAEMVILTVPWSNHQPTLETIRDAVQGKIFVDTTVPLVPPKVARVQLPEGGMAAEQAQAFLGDEVRVVSAFHNVAAAHLQQEEAHYDCDVLVCGNDKDARAEVVALAEAIGMRAWHAGPIQNTAVAESLTSVLIFINRHYKIRGAGIRITGEPGETG